MIQFKDGWTNPLTKQKTKDTYLKKTRLSTLSQLTKKRLKIQMSNTSSYQQLLIEYIQISCNNQRMRNSLKIPLIYIFISHFTLKSINKWNSHSLELLQLIQKCFCNISNYCMIYFYDFFRIIFLMILITKIFKILFPNEIMKH